MLISIQVHCMDTYNCLPWIFMCFFNIFINKRISLLNW
jgi:hypothetical protein